MVVMMRKGGGGVGFSVFDSVLLLLEVSMLLAFCVLCILV